MTPLLRDFSFALRMLRRQPGIAAVAVLTLALGIGANTAIFGVVQAVLLRPLPYRDAGRLVRVASVNPRLGVFDSRSSGRNVLDWQRNTTAFEAIACYQEWDGVLTAGGGAEPVRVNWATPNLMPMLGVQPVLGRFFTDEETGPAVVLPHGLWQRLFGGDAAALGKGVKEDDVDATVIGVLPPAAAAPVQGTPPLDQAFVRMNLATLTFPRDWQLFNVVARLRPGVSAAEAQADLSRVAADLERQYPDSNGGWGVKVTPLRQWMTEPVRGQLLAVYAASGVILLIACLNVSNLLLIRGEARRKELAIRCALGSTRGRLLRQLLAESLLLAMIGGAAGMALAAVAGRALLNLAPQSLGLRAGPLIDPPVVLSAAAVTAAAALLSGLLPALRLSGAGLNAGLGDAGRGASAGRSRHRVLGALVSGQIAVSTVLLVAAGLAVVSFQRLMRVDPGFATHNRLSCVVAGQADPKATARLLDAVAALPGVESVGAANIEVLDDLHSLPVRITIDGVGAAPGATHTVDYWIVTTSYFAAAGIPLLSGRTFDTGDLSSGASVVVINEALARRCFGDDDAVGRTLRLPGRDGQTGTPRRVIGVVASVRHHGLAESAVPMLYVHNPTVNTGSIALMLRTVGDPQAIVPVLRGAARQADPGLVVTRVATPDTIIAKSVAGRRYATLLMFAFAAVGTALAAIGLYGVMSYAVAQRTREIGIRMALGARRAAVLRLVVGRGMLLVAAGVAAGIIGAAGATRVMRSLLFNVSPTDPLTYGAITLLLGAVALLACALPARRATRVDAAVALRQD